MAAYLIDTNILLRADTPADTQYTTAASALARLEVQGERLCICSTILAEYWSVATRPAANNGMGLTPQQAGMDVDEFLQAFEMLPDDPAVFASWLDLVRTYAVCGKAAHDARIAAFSAVYEVEYILTFNGDDFARYATFTTAIQPSSAVA